MSDRKLEQKQEYAVYCQEQNKKYIAFIITVTHGETRIFEVKKKTEKNYICNSDAKSRFPLDDKAIKVFSDYRKAVAYFHIIEKAYQKQRVEVYTKAKELDERGRKLMAGAKVLEKEFDKSFMMKIDDMQEYFV